MPKMNVRKGDQVEVISGKDKGVRGEVLKAMPATGQVVVEGVAVAKKSQRPTAQNQQGGFVEKEMPIDVSNVKLVCPSCGEPVRVGHDVDESGKKVRVCKKCGAKF